MSAQRMWMMWSHAIVIGSLAIASARADDGRPACRWYPDRAAVEVVIGRRTAFSIEGIGPVRPQAEAPRGPAQDAPAGTRRESRGGASWTATGRSSPDGDFVVELASDDPGLDLVAPGTVTSAGPWIGLDLSQYALAHGQANWPKTYFLRDRGLFLCAWWDFEVSHASAAEWPDAAAEPRRGDGPFEPAARMRYVRGPDGRHAALRERLHVRVARRLWDAALPALGRPSEYREELAGMVFLDDWSGQDAGAIARRLGVLKRLAWPHVRFLTVIQNWQAAGFDALLPDSIWMPEYPPSPAVGTVDVLLAMAAAGKEIGRLAFRTNYMLLQPKSPSLARGLVGPAQDAAGKAAWYTQPSRWRDLARRQEAELAGLFRPDAGFTDQLGSGGYPGSYLDFNRAAGGDGTLATALARQRELARLIKDAHRGPLGTETLNQQDLIGFYCDYGDFGVMDGHGRLFSPEYKLRRLHAATVSYGCGLYYRFFETPPFPRFHAAQLDPWSDPALMDDYRCCEVLLGNGGYVFWPCPWPYALAETLLVGRLQAHYALAPVASVEYLAGGTWTSLEDLVRGGFCPETRPWNQKQAEFGRIRVVYENGLTVVGNRLPGEMTVRHPRGEVVLPRYGWVAYRADGSLLACSAYWPGTKDRVDYLEEGRDGLRFLNPRGARIEGSRELRLWKAGSLLWSVDPTAGVARLGGETLLLDGAAARPLEGIAADFREGLRGWAPASGILRIERGAGGLRLAVVGGDPQILSPPLSLLGRAEDVLELTLSTDSGRFGQVYFATPEDPISPRQLVQFEVTPDGRPHTIAIPVGRHPRWANRRITSVRIDPVRGLASAPAMVVLRELRLR